MQLFNTKSLRLQLFEEVHALAAKTHVIDMLIKFEIGKSHGNATRSN